MNIKQLNEELEKFLTEEQINELRPKDSGELILDFETYEDAVDKIKEKFDNPENKICAYCPNATTISWNGKKYQLAVVFGVAKETDGGMKPHGVAHILGKHVCDNGNEPTEDDLIKAAKNIHNAFNQAIKAKSKENRFVFDPFENKLIFSLGRYVYIICLEKDKEELTYLHNLFQTKGRSEDYIKGQKKSIEDRLKKELQPKFDT